MKIVPVVRTAYFTHFAVADDAGQVVSKIHRESEQLWKANGITMQIQGVMPRNSVHWGANTFNCFAKKHLLATGGKSDANTKMANIVARRDISGAAKAHASRGAELETLKKTMLIGVADAQKGTAIKKAKSELGKLYEQFAYGATRTDICTFVLLDSMRPDEAKNAFAVPIQAAEAGGWANDEKKTLDIGFPSDCVVTHELSGKQTTKNKISVDVVKHGGSGTPEYYIYHCNG